MADRNYKTRAEFALYIAAEIEAMHKLDRLGGWSNDEITLVDLAAELRAALPVTDGVWEALRRYDDEASDLVCDITRVMGRAALATRGAGPREPITVDAIHAALKSGAIKAHALQAELKSVFGMPSVELTMQDIRLHVGEGKLTPQAVLNGANAALRTAPPLPESPWKGTKTIPRDGTRFDAHLEGVDRAVVMLWNGSGFSTCDGFDWEGRKILAWRPRPSLPAAPESPKGGEG